MMLFGINNTGYTLWHGLIPKDTTSVGALRLYIPAPDTCYVPLHVYEALKADLNYLRRSENRQLSRSRQKTYLKRRQQRCKGWKKKLPSHFGK